jgi:hypothetical protein
MTKTIKMLLASALVVFGAYASTGVARAADVTNSSGNNVQSGNNRSTTRQSGTSKSGDAVGGQVVGVVSSGNTSVDARNTSDNVDVTSGDARGSNDASSFTGLNDAPATNVGGGVQTGDVANVPFADNLQDGNNRSTLSQSSDATTGDGVGGQVIGAVTAAGGSASIVAANTTRDSDIATGDSRADNSGAAFVGLNNDPTQGAQGLAAPSDITDSCQTSCDNVQSGDNTINGTQSAHAATGDGVGGQVIGVVSAGATSVDASNTTTDSDVTSGDSRANNSAGEFAGLNDAPSTTVAPADISGVPFADNLQDGNNRRSVNQTADATSGDAVAGQVTGVVTSAGGSASVVVANTSNDVDSTSGDSRFNNADAGFSGLNFGTGPVFIGAPAASGGITG